MEATAERWGVVIESILLKDITYVRALVTVNPLDLADNHRPS